ncbi:MAG: hypothetical protein QXR73_03755 [Candidatus Micrarchaeaceae archaeon]
MRAQLSLEFMVYMAAGGASLALVLAAAGASLNGIGSIDTASYISALVSEINSNMAYSRSVFSAYIPTGICNAIVNSTSITYERKSYYFADYLSFDNSICSYAGALRTFAISETGNGSYVLKVIK